MELGKEEFSYLEAIIENSSSSDGEALEDEDAKDQHAKLESPGQEQDSMLNEFEHASRALLEELSILEAEFEIEKSCRQQAEVYAAKVSQENKQLKRISVALLPHLDPQHLQIVSQEEGLPEDPIPHPAQKQVQELQTKVSTLLGEKKDLTLQVQELQSQLRKKEDQILEEQLENSSLKLAMGRSQKTLWELKRASHMAMQECSEVKQQLEVEQDLRQHAEVFARQMLVKQKEANRQSAILLQGVAPGAQLLAALEEVATLTRTLEEVRQQHKEQVHLLKLDLQTRPGPEALEALNEELRTAREETSRLGKRLQEAEERNARLEAEGG
ncbi:shootin-1-like [Ornithorhynchus anatinus]|uniref:shootin-1-like n=1 Tax=Ornithorhynchus anatinus TaxID=9258 RepID=UPI0019D42C9F|nr:shootin-1-like [Ornithorhynchus anatinus]